GDTGGDAEFLSQRIYCPVHQIFFDGFARKRITAQNAKFYARLARCFEAKLVLQRNRLKNGAEFVKTVRALAENFQAQVNFREGWDANFRHGLCQGFSIWGAAFCATRWRDWLTFFSTSATF